MRPDHVAVVVVEPIADHDDVAYVSAGVDDPVPGAERLARVHDLIDGGRDLPAVIGVFVREHQIGGGHDGARFVAVHPLHLFRPFPPLIGEVEPKPARGLRVAAGQRLLDAGRCAVEFPCRFHRDS